MKAFATRVWQFVLTVILRIRADEPLRNRLRPIITAISTYLVGKGIVSEQVADIVTGLVLLALGYGAIEWARRLVMPMKTVIPLIEAKGQQAYQEGVEDAVDAVKDDLSERAAAALKTLPPHLQAILDRAREAGLFRDTPGEHRAN